MILVADQAKASEMKDQLERQGFLVIEIVATTFAKSTQHQSDLPQGEVR
jgi:hypothetical protein